MISAILPIDNYLIYVNFEPQMSQKDATYNVHLFV